MRTIAISDIHGCYKELKILLATLESEGEYNKNTDKLVFLGDYIDRGENSRQVIELIRDLQKNNNNVVALMGNHEDMMLNYFDGFDKSWLYNGHKDTLKSYEGFDKQFEDDIEWMRNLPLWHEDEHFIYVHAGVDTDKPLEQQKKYTLLWTRESFIYNSSEYYKKIIFGHTPTMNFGLNEPAYTSAGNIDIDTGCVYGGALTALIIDDNEVIDYYQVSKEIEEKAIV